MPEQTNTALNLNTGLFTSSHLPWHAAEGLFLRASVTKGLSDDAFITLGSETPRRSQDFLCEQSWMWSSMEDRPD